jgi:hypothetical protein
MQPLKHLQTAKLPRFRQLSNNWFQPGGVERACRRECSFSVVKKQHRPFSKSEEDGLQLVLGTEFSDQQFRLTTGARELET